MNEIYMSDEEKNLLSIAYTDDERIRKGLLFDYQEESLMLLRKAHEYLSQKYDKDFQFTGFLPLRKDNPVSEILFEEEESSYVLKAVISDHEYEFSDNYYAVPFKGAYNSWFDLKLKEYGLHGMSDTTFPYPSGIKISLLSDLTENDGKLGQETRIYLFSDTKKDSDMDAIRHLAESEGIHMSVLLYYVGKDTKASFLTEVKKLVDESTPKVMMECFKEGK